MKVMIVNCKLCMYCYISPSSECLFLYLNESYTLLYVNKYVLRLSSWIFLWEKKMPNLCYFMTNVTFICINTLYVLYIILQIFYVKALPCQHFLYLLCLAKQFPYLSCHRKNNKIINIHWPIQAANLEPSNNQVPSKLNEILHDSDMWPILIISWFCLRPGCNISLLGK